MKIIRIVVTYKRTAIMILNIHYKLKRINSYRKFVIYVLLLLGLLFSTTLKLKKGTMKE